MSKSLEYKLGNMVNVRSTDAAIRLRKSINTIDLLTLIDPQQIIVFFRDNVDRMPLRGLVDLKTISGELEKTKTYDEFVGILDHHNANIFSQNKLNQMAKNFNNDVINTAIEALYEWDHKLKKNLTRISRLARTSYIERGVWPLYASYGFLKGLTIHKTPIKAPLVSIAIDFEFDGAKLYLVKKDKRQSINERLYVFLMREYGVKLPIHDFEAKTDLAELAVDLEKITQQPITYDKTQPLVAKYKDENKDDIESFSNLSILSNAVITVVELTGGKLKEDLAQILDRQEDDPFESNDTQKTNEYFENQIIEGEEQLVEIHQPINIFQKYAINSVLHQNTVIIGAPGTGKSEVITNLIANIIHRKKNAMVVSEKQAALDVIYNRVGKLNQLILYMYDFKNKEDFYKNVLGIEETLGQWYRKDFNDPEIDLIDEKILTFRSAYNHFYNLTKNEIELSRARDPYNEIFTEYSSSHLNQTEVVNRVRVSSYLILPDNSTNREPWIQLKQYLIRSTTTPIAVNFQRWYEKNQYLFDEANFDFFLRNTWNEYVNFKDLCEKHKVLLDNFPRLLENLLRMDRRSERRFISEWITLRQRKFIYVFSAMNEDDNIIRKTPLLFKIDLSREQKQFYKNNYLELKEFLRGFNRIKKLNWISYNKLEEYALSTSEWKTVIQENWWSNLFSNNALLDVLRNNAFQEAIQTMRRNTEIFAKDNDELIVTNFLKWQRARLNALPKEETDQILEMFKQASKATRPPVNFFIRQYYKQLRQIFPIWVLSPDNVAEFIPLKRKEFDYGIFDEASQMFLERGYPLVYRCTNNAVAGDMNQLKPTSFFMSRFDDSETSNSKTEEFNFDDDSDYEFDENEAIVSLLEKAETARWNKFHLRNHYRSASKQLIEFSNKNIYDNNLHVATLNGNWSNGIETIEANGIWSNQCNEKEAEVVVEQIKENFDKYDSILVIAFNLKQSLLIENMLINDDSIDGMTRERLNKKLVISNLENVQGTEADLVILSVAFAPGTDGILRANFGVLNRDGGRNRLNVAITRSKKKMIVVKSFAAKDIGSRSLSPEAMVFIDYIRYLDTLSQTEKSDLLAFSKNSYQDFETPFNKTIYQAILDLNIGDDIYVKTKLPVGNKVIDIGVMDTKTNKCILGIIAEQWTANMNVKSKFEEYDHQLFLESRNFKMFRIKQYEWSTIKEVILASLRSHIINNIQ
ncbi:AAA domain-containing protein [[Mycoplasma] testudinis]|uniref:AAA domain-containing protein n=1 Tax=[Mycoplasma] testudinis TaxID=33924 RepID=UPI000480AC96|nr:AAA domain-containing protein [[Mycoplasma] testudinis]